MHVLVMAKAPVARSSKTRLCPPCTPAEAADIAEACLADTLATALACGADRCLLAIDGEPGPWLPPGVTVFPQQGASFNERLANAWDMAGGPGLQIGMDTPQLTAALIDDGLDALSGQAVDAVLGPATDGGWWAIGLMAADRSVFDGVPMSRDDTGAQQRERMEALGLRVGALPSLTDVDTWDDAVAVAAAAPMTRFAGAVRRLEQAEAVAVATR